jgi:hypothetical protein
LQGAGSRVKEREEGRWKREEVRQVAGYKSQGSSYKVKQEMGEGRGKQKTGARCR